MKARLPLSPSGDRGLGEQATDGESVLTRRRKINKFLGLEDTRKTGSSAKSDGEGRADNERLKGKEERTHQPVKSIMVLFRVSRTRRADLGIGAEFE